MRYLSFSAVDGPLYHVALLSVQGAEPERDAFNTRLAGKLLDKLESIGEPTAPDAATGFGGFALVAAGMLALEDTEFTKFKTMIEHAPIFNRLVRTKIALMDRLEVCPTVAPPATP